MMLVVQGTLTAQFKNKNITKVTVVFLSDLPLPSFLGGNFHPEFYV